MVIKYWNIYYDVPVDIEVIENQHEVKFTISLPKELQIAHNKQITFLGFQPAMDLVDAPFTLSAFNIVNNDNMYVTKDKEPAYEYYVIGDNGYYPHPKSFRLNDEIEEIHFKINSVKSLLSNSFLIETKVEYEF